MRITDNGKGFQPERSAHGKKNRRLGLLGMRERVEMVRGQFSVASTPGKGTTIEAQFPFIASMPQPKALRVSSNGKS
jgi:signal transduction histidine kinase